MKRLLILTFLLVFGASVVSGQQGGKSLKYYNRTEAGFAFGIGSYNTDIYDGIRKSLKNNEIVISLQTVNGILFNDRVALGAGIGVEKWQNGLFYPLFGQLSYFLKPVDNTFFGDVSVGYGFWSRDATSYHQTGNGALMFSVGLGYIRSVSKRLQFHFEAFYRYQAIESAYNVYIEDTLRSTVDYKVPLSFIGFRVGIHFK
jgi:hypothetical protein